MGFLTLYRKAKKKERELRFLLLGLDNAGKSTILKYILEEDVYDVTPTFGFCIRSKAIHKAMVNFWDIGGQFSLRPFWKNYFEQTHGVIWVVDGSDQGRYSEHIQEFKLLLRESHLIRTSILVLVNKSDLYEKEDLDRLCREMNFTENRQHIHILPCSALSGSGIHEGLEWLCNDIHQRI